MGARNKCLKDAEASDENGKARGRHVALCKLPSKTHPTSLEAACGAALLLLITPNSALPIQFNTSATLGKAFYSQSQPKISGERLIRSLFLLPADKIYATEKRRRPPPPSTGASERVIVPGSFKNPGCSGQRNFKTVRRFNHRKRVRNSITAALLWKGHIPVWI